MSKLPPIRGLGIQDVTLNQPQRIAPAESSELPPRASYPAHDSQSTLHGSPDYFPPPGHLAPRLAGAGSAAQLSLQESLNAIEQRPKAPSFATALRPTLLKKVDNKFTAAFETVTGAFRSKTGRFKRSRPRPKYEWEDLSLRPENTYSSEGTFALLSEFIRLLAAYLDQGGDLHSVGQTEGLSYLESVESMTWLDPIPSQPDLSHSASYSSDIDDDEEGDEGDEEGEEETSDIISRCIELLSSLIFEDCRFQVISPTPLRPPNSLQALTLEFARLLFAATSGEEELQIELAFTMLPAFDIFRLEMLPKLLGFMIQWVVKNWAAYLMDVRMDLLWKGSTNEKVAVDNSDVISSASWQTAEDDEEWSTDEFDWLFGYPTSNHPALPALLRRRNEIFMPLLGSIIDRMSILSGSEPSLELCQALDIMVVQKEDSYLDILGVIATSAFSKERKAMLSLFAAGWSRSLGHTYETLPLPVPLALLSEDQTRDTRRPNQFYRHQFLPWCFIANPEYDALGVQAGGTCIVCDEQILGLGLRCSGCETPCHMLCYDDPQGTFVAHYSPANDPSMQKLAIFRYCDVILPVLNKYDRCRIQGHSFIPVNLFTMTLCSHCEDPLWGCIMQAWRCELCNMFVHAECMDKIDVKGILCKSGPINAACVTIEYDKLVESFKKEHEDFFEQDVKAMAYNQVSLMQSYLATQEMILTNGIAMGSLVLLEEFRPFELHFLQDACQDALKVPPKPSISLEDFLLFNHIDLRNHAIAYNLPVLHFITAHLKLPLRGAELLEAASSSMIPLDSEDSVHGTWLPGGKGNTEEYDGTEDGLDVDSNALDALELSENSQAYEIVSLMHIFCTFIFEFDVEDDLLQMYLFRQLLLNGFIDCTQKSVIPCESQEHLQNTYYNFPLGATHEKKSRDVTQIVGTIEQCLEDIDVSVNEIALSLLRRFDGDRTLDQHVVARMLYALYKWILDEEHCLNEVLRNYVTKGLPVPGLRSSSDPQPWPASQSSRSAASSLNSGNNYAACRRALLVKKALPWMANQFLFNPSFYSKMMFDYAIRYVRNHIPWFDTIRRLKTEAERELALADKSLICILKVAQTSAMFTCFDEVLRTWFSNVIQKGLCDERIPSLARAFTKDADLNSRATMAVIGANGSKVTLEPWTMLKNFAAQESNALDDVMTCVSLVARSGADVPNSIYLHFMEYLNRPTVSPDQCYRFIEALMHSVHARSLGRQEILDPLLQMQDKVLCIMEPELRKATQRSVDYMRLCLAISLLLYGCPREQLKATGIISSKDKFISRKNIVRAVPVTEVVQLAKELPRLLLTYINTRVESVCYLISRFLVLCTSDCSLVQEATEWIKANSATMFKILWVVYDLKNINIDEPRAILFSRFLVIDPAQYRNLLDEQTHPDCAVMLRYTAIHKIYRMVMDSMGQVGHRDQKQFRANLFHLYKLFFSSIWTSDDEEIRQAVDVWLMTLLPGQLHILTACWNEIILNTPMPIRLQVLSYVAKLMYQFKDWKPVAWPVISELLEQCRSPGTHGGAGPGLTEDEAAAQEASALVIALRMLGTQPRPKLTHFKLVKYAVARALGFEAYVPPFQRLKFVPQLGLSCVLALVELLDSPHKMLLTGATMANPLVDGNAQAEVLVGSYFVDLFLALINELENLRELPIIELNRVMDGLVIIPYKHKLTASPLTHLQLPYRRAVSRTLLLLTPETSLETQQLIQSVAHAYLLHCETLQLSAIAEIIQALLWFIQHYEHDADNQFVTQARTIARLGLERGVRSGVIIALFKMERDADFFEALKDTIIGDENMPKDDLDTSLLHDTVRRLKERTQDEVSSQHILNNLAKYIQIVYNRKCGQEILLAITSALQDIVRKNKEWISLNISSVMDMLATLLKNNPGRLADISGTIDYVLEYTIWKLPTDTGSLRKLAETLEGMKTPSVAGVAGQDFHRTFVSRLVKTLWDAFNLRSPLPASVLAPVFEVSYLFIIDRLDRRVDFIKLGLEYLRKFMLLKPDEQPNLQVSLMIAEHVVDELQGDTGVLRAVFSTIDLRPWGLRWWTLVLYFIVKKNVTVLDELFWEYFYEVEHTWGYTMTDLVASDDAAASKLSYAYITFKLFTLMGKRAEGLVEGTAMTKRCAYSEMLWNNLWIGLVQVAQVKDIYHHPIATAVMAQATMADIGLFLAQVKDENFGTPLRSVTWSKWRREAAQPATKAKFTRLDNWKPSNEPLVYPSNHFIDQVLLDMQAAEKAHIVEVTIRNARS